MLEPPKVPPRHPPAKVQTLRVLGALKLATPSVVAMRAVMLSVPAPTRTRGISRHRFGQC